MKTESQKGAFTRRLILSLVGALVLALTGPASAARTAGPMLRGGSADAVVPEGRKLGALFADGLEPCTRVRHVALWTASGEQRRRK